MPENTKMQNLISLVMSKFQFNVKLTYQENRESLLSIVLTETVNVYELKTVAPGNKAHMQSNLLALSKDVSLLDTSPRNFFHEISDLLYFGKLDKVIKMFHQMMMSIFDLVVKKIPQPCYKSIKRRSVNI